MSKRLRNFWIESETDSRSSAIRGGGKDLRTDLFVKKDGESVKALDIRCWGKSRWINNYSSFTTNTGINKIKSC